MRSEDLVGSFCGFGAILLFLLGFMYFAETFLFGVVPFFESFFKEE